MGRTCFKLVICERDSLWGIEWGSAELGVEAICWFQILTDRYYLVKVCYRSYGYNAIKLFRK